MRTGTPGTATRARGLGYPVQRRRHEDWDARQNDSLLYAAEGDLSVKGGWSVEPTNPGAFSITQRASGGTGLGGATLTACRRQTGQAAAVEGGAANTTEPPPHHPGHRCFCAAPGWEVGFISFIQHLSIHREDRVEVYSVVTEPANRKTDFLKRKKATQRGSLFPPAGVTGQG